MQVYVNMCKAEPTHLENFSGNSEEDGMFRERYGGSVLVYIHEATRTTLRPWGLYGRCMYKLNLSIQKAVSKNNTNF